MGSEPTNEYLRNAVMTASPAQLQLMLYDGAIRFASQAREALQARDFARSYELLRRAERIVLELDSGLRPEVNPDLCKRMAALYAFIHRKLLEADVHKDVSCLDDALKILRHIRETWVMLMDKLAQENRQAADTTDQPEPEPQSICVEG